MPTTSRPLLLPLTALVLALDGLAALVLSGASFLFMNFSVAAIEGRSGNPNGHLIWWVVGLLAVAIVAFLAAWRAARRVRTGRFLGMLVAGATAVAVGWGVLAMLVGRQIDLGGAILGAAIVLAQMLVLFTLLRWDAAQR